MNTFLTDKNRAVRRAVRAFCEREIAPIAKQIDQEASFPWEVADKMGRLGYFGIQAPKTLGGAELDTVSYVLIIEEISRASGGLGLCVTVHNSVAVAPLLAFGTEAQKQRWIPPLARGEKIGAFCLTEPNAGSDASGIEATALRDGDHYCVNAGKVLVTNGGIADLCLIFARTDPKAGRRGISVIVAERGTPGFSVGDLEDLCGMRANPVSSIRLADCLIPVENRLGREGMGLAIGLAALDTGRIGIAAQAVGIAQAALEESVRYAKERRQFGVPIARHQSIQQMIADMATDLDAARLMVLRAAVRRDRGDPFSQASAMAKLHASEAAMRITDQAVQIHGGYGYSKAYPVERYWRDARVTRIYEGTSEIHRMVIARGVLGD
ncbi:MAG: acyl-CoA dehydrogenase family protein [Syntrophales bacterium]|jgi:butyryl-CoA dehydrogenase|nr:acyl-CoA dehydrogenase family protein [Syntrophales bacterium]MDD4339883.1 acyl-CoA dehydrogenase family protein [Syntrophales bacterium]HOG07500.1 acyl-CoA dehydrogenase family protein [Syntrophales bacterium]HOS76772.1 acyl-CoA dehydrogenase family protein [Syntrophales bacterium]HPB69431.1 acyl-CoA dehydrogenase family protein [Syntrophales bacterium]